MQRDRTKSLSLRKKLLFAALPIVASLLVLEAGARVWFTFADDETRRQYALYTEDPQAVRFRPHQYLGYTLQPGYRRGKTSHNSLGYRGPEIAVPKPPGVFRIAILGGSTTYTEFVRDDEKTFPFVLQTLLRDRLGNEKIEVVNAGVPGYNSWESLGNLCYRVLDIEPDLVIVHHGVNDAHCRLVHPDFYQSDNSGRRIPWTVPLDVKLLRYSLLARIVGRQCGVWSHPGVDAFVRAPTCDPGVSGASSRIGGDPEAVLDRNPPIYFERNLGNMIGVARVNNVDVALSTWAHCPAIQDYSSTPHYERAFKELNDVVRRLAAEQNVHCIDFEKVMSRDPKYWRDGRHVNEAGAALKAQLFADSLVQMVFGVNEFNSPNERPHALQAASDKPGGQAR